MSNALYGEFVYEVVEEDTKAGGVTYDDSSYTVQVNVTRNADGTYSQSVYSREESIVVPRAADDGVIDWAKFHLGFRNWENNCGDLYISV